MSTTLLPSNLVLFAFVHVANGWYGDRYRYILSPTNSSGFKNKTEAKRFGSKLTRFLKLTRQRQVLVKNLNTDIMENLKTYEFISGGPSFSCTHIYITVDEVETYLKDHTKRKPR